MQDLVALAAIGNPEAATYGNSFSIMSILLIAIALGFLIMMIGSRGRQAQGEQQLQMNRTSSRDWIASRPFLIGWGMAVASAFFIVTILLRAISHYARLSNPENFVLRWCYDCSSFGSALGPELSLVVGILSLAGLIIGIIMVIAKGRQTLSHESR